MSVLVYILRYITFVYVSERPLQIQKSSSKERKNNKKSYILFINSRTSVYE